MPLPAARPVTTSPRRTARFPDFAALLQALLLVAVAVALQGESAAQVDPPTLRIVTYNIHHGAGNDQCDAAPTHGGDCGLDLERIARVVLAHQPDIVALQEVDRFWKRSAGTDQAAELARLLEMEPCYGANLKLPADVRNAPGREYGTLIMSRHPIAQCSNHLLPKASESAEQRGVLRADVEVDGRVLSIWNTHLHIRQEDRLLQTKAIVDLLREGRDAPGPTSLVVLLGDLNARPGAPELSPLQSVFRDAWVVAGHGDGHTSPAAPNQPPRSRIDYILTSPDIAISSIVVDQGAETAMTSDHYPVAAVIRLP